MTGHGDGGNIKRSKSETLIGRHIQLVTWKKLDDIDDAFQINPLGWKVIGGDLSLIYERTYFRRARPGTQFAGILQHEGLAWPGLVVIDDDIEDVTMAKLQHQVVHEPGSLRIIVHPELQRARRVRKSHRFLEVRRSIAARLAARGHHGQFQNPAAALRAANCESLQAVFASAKLWILKPSVSITHCAGPTLCGPRQIRIRLAPDAAPLYARAHKKAKLQLKWPGVR